MSAINQNLNRREGYYWVRTPHGNWHIGFWNTTFGNFHWTVCWQKHRMYDEDFGEIDENEVLHKENKIKINQ